MAGRDRIPQLPLQSPVGSGHGGQATIAISGQLMNQEERNYPFLETHHMPGAVLSTLYIQEEAFKRPKCAHSGTGLSGFEAQICLTSWGPWSSLCASVSPL